MIKKNGENKDSFLLSIPPFIFLLPVITVLAVYLPNVHRLPAEIFFYSVFCLLLSFLFFVFIMRLLLRDKKVADSVSALAYIGLCFLLDISGYWSLLWFGVFLVFAIFCIIKRNVPNVLKFGMYVIAANVFVQSVLHSKNVLVLFNRSSLNEQLTSKFNPLPSNIITENKRDIYYIILDRYARADQLKSVYGYDNSEFIHALERRGMHVASEAYSNYQRTAHSLTSSLNLSYLPEIETSNNYDWLPLYQQLKNSELFRFFDKLDYEIYNMGSWWEVTRQNKFADVEVNFRSWPELLRVIFEKSVFGKLALFNESESLDPRTLQCIRAKHKFEYLEKLPSQFNADSPKFVFAHFLVPHPPYVIDRDGNCVEVSVAESRTREQNYIEQVMFVNKQILKFLDEVDSFNGAKPIIVLQADEGPWPKKFVRDEIKYLGRDVTNVDWTKISSKELDEKMAILNAVYFPEKPNFKFPSNASPVNNFRYVLNEYFSAKIPIKENKSFIYLNNKNLYRYDDVTDKLKYK